MPAAPVAECTGRHHIVVKHIPPRVIALPATGRKAVQAAIGCNGFGREQAGLRHGVAELLARLSHGRLLFSGPDDDIKRRFTRLQFRASDDPVVAGLGTVLHRQTLGRQLDLLIQDPSSDAADRLRAQAGVSDVEEAVPGLEDIYAAVMRNAGHSVPGVPS